MAVKFVQITVEGSGTFPLDMLRYDCAYPKTSDDVSAMRGNGKRQVILIARAMTPARWASFGWRVTSSRNAL